MLAGRAAGRSGEVMVVGKAAAVRAMLRIDLARALHAPVGVLSEQE